MSTNMPRTIPELIAWSNVHVDLWQQNATSIGISSAQALAFKTLVGSMVTNVGKSDAARQASKDATMNSNTSIDAVRAIGGAYINMIKAYAETTNNPAVYSLGGVSPDDPQSVLPPPIAPNDFTATVNGGGSLTIRWRVTQPAGVTNVQYLVSRRLIGESTFTLVASEGKNKSFTDETLPVGVDRVEYLLQPKRGEVYGPQSNIFTVQFGSVMGGGMNITTASVPHAEPMKIAA